MTNLNIGCGSLAIKEWDNLDYDSTLINWFLTYSPSLLPYFKVHDVLNGIPYPNESVDRIYLSNFIEHLEPIECRKFLRECLRVLKYNGKLRILVPNMDVILKHYNENNMDIFNEGQPEMFKKSSASAKLSYILFGNLYNSDPNYPKGGMYLGHKMAYNSESLSCLLSEVGFKITNSNAFQDILDMERDHLPLWYMLIMEAEK